MEWAQTEHKEVSGTDLIKNRGSVPRISPCQGHIVLILVQIMDIIMLGLYTELYTSANCDIPWYTVPAGILYH